MAHSKFRTLVPKEKTTIATAIRESGASIVFVGLGCPRQEIFAYEFRNLVDLPIIAFGASFPFLANKLPEAPQWMQNAGPEWFFRILSEPRRLWRRYIFLNPTYMLLVTLQMLGFSSFSTRGQAPIDEPVLAKCL